MLKLLTVLVGLGAYLLLFAIFLTAFFSSGKAVTVYINEYNEAHFELFLLSLYSPFCFAGGYFLIRDLAEGGS